MIPPASKACTQCGPSWPLLGGGAVLLLAVGGLLYYLLFRRPLSLLPAIQDVFPDGRQNNTVTLPDGGIETNTIDVRDGGLGNFTVSWHDPGGIESNTIDVRDGGLGNATVSFHDPAGLENTIGGKDISDLSGNGMS